MWNFRFVCQSGRMGNVEKQEIINKLVLSANEAGFAVHTHAIGDKASKMILDAYQYAETQTCDFDRRNVACHLQIVRPEDVKRCADYNVIAVVAPTWAPVTHPTFDETLAYLGEKRAWWPMCGSAKHGWTEATTEAQSYGGRNSLLKTCSLGIQNLTT